MHQDEFQFRQDIPGELRATSAQSFALIITSSLFFTPLALAIIRRKHNDQIWLDCIIMVLVGIVSITYWSYPILGLRLFIDKTFACLVSAYGLIRIVVSENAIQIKGFLLFFGAIGLCFLGASYYFWLRFNDTWSICHCCWHISLVLGIHVFHHLEPGRVTKDTMLMLERRITLQGLV